MLKSFTYMFSDKSFGKKYLALFGILFIANSLINWSSVFSPVLNDGAVSIWYYILFLLGFFIMFTVFGHSISILRVTLKDNQSLDLPILTVVRDFIAGVKVVISCAILVILFLLFLVAVGLLGKLLSIFSGIVSYVIISVIIILSIFILAFSGIAMCCRYVVKPSILNFIDFKSAFQLINNSVSKYFIAFILSIIVLLFPYLVSYLIVSILSKIGYIGLVIYCVLISLIWAYQIYVFAGLFARAVESDKI